MLLFDVLRGDGEGFANDGAQFVDAAAVMIVEKYRARLPPRQRRLKERDHRGREATQVWR